MSKTLRSGVGWSISHFRTRGTPWAAWSVLCLAWYSSGCSAPSATEPSAALGRRADACRTNPSHGWNPRGVGGGGALFSPSINPHRGREIYMSSDMTGVYHTTDFGANWEMLHFRTLQGGIRTRVQFTADPRVLYAVHRPAPPNGPTGIVKSVDAGRTWDALVVTPGNPDSRYYLFADPNSTQRLLYSDRDRLYFSGNGGGSFAEVYATAWEGGLLVAGVHWHRKDIYVGTSDGVLVSHDGGITFALDPLLQQGIPAAESIVSFAGASQGGLTRFVAVTFTNRDADGNATVTADITGLDVDLFAGLYRMTLGQPGWERSTDGLASQDKLSFVAMSDTNANIAYAAGGDRTPSPIDPNAGIAPVVLKTMDGGLHWAHVFLTQHNANIATGWSGYGGDLDWYFGEFALGLSVSPRDANRAVMTDLGFVHVTQNGGARWDQAYVNPRDENPPGRDTPRSRFYRTSGVEQTGTWWLTWSDRHRLFASMTDIRSAFSRDGGLFWTRDGNNGLTLNTTYHVVKHPDSGMLYAGTSRIHDIYQSPWLRDSRLDGTPARPALGAVMQSADGGASWSLYYDFKRPVIWLALDPRDPNQLYASTVNSMTGGIYHLDLGQPASEADALPAPPRTKGHPYNLYVLADGSLLTTYSGHQDGNSRVFTDRSGVFLLPKGATAWEDRSAPEMHYWTKDVVIDPRDQNHWYVGVFTHDDRNFGGLYRTRDQGLTWKRISSHYRVESCAFDPKDPNRLYLTTESEGLWITDDVSAEEPVFRQVDDYPFQHPMRVFFNPYDLDEVWTVSFGGGIRMKRER